MKDKLILRALSALSTLMCNPALGGGSSLRMSDGSELLSALGVVVGQGEDSDLEEFTESIEDMALRARAPNQMERDFMCQLLADAPEEPEPVPVDRGGNPLELEEPEEEEEEEYVDPATLTSEHTPAVETLPDDDNLVVEQPEEEDSPPTG